MTCQTCNGSCEIEMGPPGYQKKKCPDCNGTGDIETIAQVKSEVNLHNQYSKASLRAALLKDARVYADTYTAFATPAQVELIAKDMVMFAEAHTAAEVKKELQDLAEAMDHIRKKEGGPGQFYIPSKEQNLLDERIKELGGTS